MSTLRVDDFIIGIRLGWTEVERAEPQPVGVCFEIRFEQTPMACNTDQLSDTADYHSIVEEIRKLVSDRSYKLLERLAFEVYSTIRAELLPIRAGIRVKVTKLKPPVQGIEGGVSFSYGDFEP